MARLNKKGKIFVGILTFILFIMIIQIMPNAEPQRMDTKYSKWNGEYYEAK